MTTLNARANQAWNEIEPVKNDWDPMPFYGQQEAFEEGWETGYKARQAELPTQEQIIMAIDEELTAEGVIAHALDRKLAAAVLNLLGGAS